MVKEPPKMQEMGPKKYGEHIRKQNKFYDTYKAGKKDPKTGEYFHKISGRDPNKPKYTYGGGSVGYLECPTGGCDHVVALRRVSAGFICPKCKKFISISSEDIKAAVEREG